MKHEEPKSLASQPQSSTGPSATGPSSTGRASDVACGDGVGTLDERAFRTGEPFGLGVAQHRSWAMLQLAHARATERVGRIVEAEGGLAPDWYDVLLALEYAPDNRLRMGELARYVTLSPSGLTRLVDRIEAAGLVERHLCPTDRRAFETVLTPAGRAAREQTWPLYARAVAEGFGERLNDEEAGQLAELLERQLADR